jgi:hypothetical protein
MASEKRPKCGGAGTREEGVLRRQETPTLQFPRSRRRKTLRERLLPWGAALLLLVIALAGAGLVKKFLIKPEKGAKPRPAATDTTPTAPRAVSPDNPGNAKESAIRLRTPDRRE